MPNHHNSYMNFTRQKIHRKIHDCVRWINASRAKPFGILSADKFLCFVSTVNCCTERRNIHMRSKDMFFVPFAQLRYKVQDKLCCIRATLLNLIVICRLLLVFRLLPLTTAIEEMVEMFIIIFVCAEKLCFYSYLRYGFAQNPQQKARNKKVPVRAIYWLFDGHKKHGPNFYPTILFEYFDDVQLESWCVSLGLWVSGRMWWRKRS